LARALSSEARAKVFAEENGIPKWYGSYEELTQDPAVQVVYVAGTTNAHAESSKLALNNGKHVLCEKAFAMNLREAREVSDLAKKKGLFVMEVLTNYYIQGTVHGYSYHYWLLCMINSMSNHPPPDKFHE
jgi:predicted dehydrogenase